MSCHRDADGSARTLQNVENPLSPCGTAAVRPGGIPSAPAEPGPRSEDPAAADCPPVGAAPSDPGAESAHWSEVGNETRQVLVVRQHIPEQLNGQ